MNIKNIVGYRCNSISAIDGFLPVRNVFKLEMFGDDGDKGFRNIDGMLDEFQNIFPKFDDELKERLFYEVDINKLKFDDDYRYMFTDYLISILQSECGVPKEYFNYGIWLCDSPQDVMDSYNGVDADDISEYKIKGVMLQDLGTEGKLYGVAEYPEENIEETTKYNMNELTDKDFEKLYEECVCAGSSSGAGAPISDFVPENVIGTSMGPNYFMKGKSDIDFPNDTMKVHKNRKGKKGDAITGTGIVYANGKMHESVLNESDFEEIAEYGEDHDGETVCCNCGADCSEDGEFIHGDLYCPSCAEHERQGNDE